jgi:hypothetical protein
MAQATTIILLPQTPGRDILVTGDKQPAASYYQGNKNLQTLTWDLTGFKGTIIVEATLADDPGTSDWVTVKVISNLVDPGLTERSFENNIGNFVWMRVRVNPFYTGGVIQYIKVSY